LKEKYGYLNILSKNYQQKMMNTINPPAMLSPQESLLHAQILFEQFCITPLLLVMGYSFIIWNNR